MYFLERKSVWWDILQPLHVVSDHHPAAAMTDSDQLFSQGGDGGDSATADDELSLMFSQPEDTLSVKDPYACDPSFENEEEMERYLQKIGQKDIFIATEKIEVDVADEIRGLSCDCENCSPEMKISDCQDYLCCNQLFNWKELLTPEENGAMVSCVTKTRAYIGSVNSFAVKGEYYI